MTKKILSVITLLIVSSFVESKDKKLEDPKPLDYFVFSLVWPNSYCNSWRTSECKEPIPQEFKILSLVSNKSNKLQKQSSSTGSTFHAYEVKNWNFSLSLAYLWPYLGRKRGTGNERYWKHQWNLYGTSTGMSPENYFYLAVKYAKQYENVHRGLLDSGVVTPSRHSYQKQVLHDAIAEVVGSSPTINCNTFESEKQFLSIRICISNSNVAFDCPNKFNKCGYSNGFVLFPTTEMVSSSRGLQDTVQSPIFKWSVSTTNQSSTAIDFGPNVSKNTSSSNEEFGPDISNVTMI